MRKLPCFRIADFGRYCAVPSVRMRVRSGGLLCLLCVMLLVPLAKGYNVSYIIYNFKIPGVLKYIC
jgi:hypothetical protein